MKTNQSQQFAPTHQSVAAILKGYDLTLESFRAATSGIENCTLFVQTNQGERVLRIYQNRTNGLERIQQEVAFMNYLSTNGIDQLPVLITNQSGSQINSFTLNDKTWYAVLMTRMPGDHATAYSPTLLSDMATIQARMHLLALDYKSPHPVARRNDTLQESQFAHLIARTVLDQKQQAFVDRATAYRYTLADTLPRGFCHLDYDYGNILSDTHGHITGVLDFDDLSYAPFVVCLGYTLWDIYYDGGQAVVDEYIRLYQLTRGLTTAEKDALHHVMLFRNYVIGCLKLAHSTLEGTELAKYLAIEADLLQ